MLKELENMLEKLAGRTVNVGISGFISKYYEIDNFSWWINENLCGIHYLELHKEMDWDLLSLSMEDIKDVEFNKNNKEVTMKFASNLSVSLWVG